MEDLRRMREEAGLTQVSLAKVSGVDRATINKVEQGKRSPSIETLEKLAEALDIEVADFFPKAQAPLPFEVESATGLQPLNRADESVMEALADQWRKVLEEYNRELPEEESHWGLVQRGRALMLLEWAREVMRTTIAFEVVGEELWPRPGPRYKAALQEMEEVSSAASSKAGRMFKRAETNADFQRIVKETELLRDIQLDV